jgi:hypothetical protein
MQEEGKLYQLVQGIWNLRTSQRTMLCFWICVKVDNSIRKKRWRRMVTGNKSEVSQFIVCRDVSSVGTVTGYRTWLQKRAGISLFPSGLWTVSDQCGRSPFLSFDFWYFADMSACDSGHTQRSCTCFMAVSNWKYQSGQLLVPSPLSVSKDLRTAERVFMEIPFGKL